MDKRKKYAYGGFARYLYVIAERADEAAFLPILDAFKKRGYRVCYRPDLRGEKADDRIDAASGVIVFVSRVFVQNDALLDAVARASCEGKTIISVGLEAVDLPAAHAMLLESRQALRRYEFTDDDAFYERLFSSQHLRARKPTRQRVMRRLRAVGGWLGGALLLLTALALAVLFTARALLSPFEKQPAVQTAEETAAQPTVAATDAAAQTTGQVSYTPGAPLTVDDLSSIQGLWIVGAEIFEDSDRFDDPAISKGSIGDLSDLAQFPNLTSIRLYKQSEPVDLSFLFSCKSLRRVYLNDVRVVTFEGIEKMQSLSVLSIVDCGTVDLTPLKDCDLSFAEKEQDGLRLVLTGTKLTDYAALGGVRRYKSLRTDAPVAEIAPGLARCKQIDELVCSNVKSMAAFGALPCVASLTVEDDRVTSLAGMEGLSNLTSLSVSAGLKSIGKVEEMPKLTSLNASRNPIRSLDGLWEAFPNLKSAAFNRISVADREKLEGFLAANN